MESAQIERIGYSKIIFSETITINAEKRFLSDNLIDIHTFNSIFCQNEWSQSNNDFSKDFD